MRSHSDYLVWPGFVDALATLVMVTVFLLLVFVSAHSILNRIVVGQNVELDRLSSDMAALAEQLDLEKSTNATLNAQLSATIDENETLLDTIEESERALEAQQQQELELQQEKENWQNQASTLRAELGASSERELQLEQQLAALNTQLSRLNTALDAAKARDQEQQARIVNLGKELNAALANEVVRLAQFRSVFFARMQESLQGRTDVRIDGDRFILPSEVLFASGSAVLESEGEVHLRGVVETIQSLESTIPETLNWIIRIDGHTDNRPISTSTFASNWELSLARAQAITKLLINEGVPPERLAPAGFAHYHPIDTRQNPTAWKFNRRIEFKLTQR